MSGEFTTKDVVDREAEASHGPDRHRPTGGPGKSSTRASALVAVAERRRPGRFLRHSLTTRIEEPAVPIRAVGFSS